jgi:hypothetical protein
MASQLFDRTLQDRGATSDELAETRASAAQKELERETGVSKVENTIMSGTPLDRLLNPANRPKLQRPRPSIERPYERCLSMKGGAP